MISIDVPVEIDDSELTEWLTKKAKNELFNAVRDMLAEQAKDEIYASGYNGWDNRPDWVAFTKDAVRDVIADREDDVVELAAAAMARKTKNSERWRDIVRQVHEEKDKKNGAE